MSPHVRAIGLFLATLFSLAAQTGSKGKVQTPPNQTPAPVRIAPAMGPPAPDPKLLAHSPAETFIYGANWRLIRAGTVTLEAMPSKISMRLESAGLVASLFKVNDTYTANYNDTFCAATARLESNEGKRQREALVTYDSSANRAHYVERDRLSGSVLHEASVDLPPCASDVVGAILRWRKSPMEPGSAMQLPLSDGRRAAMVKVEAQEREEIKVPAGTFKAVRYEAGIFNGVIYTRKGKAQIWYTDDDRHIPVQIRLRMNFPVGTVTLELEKQEGP
jgi:hypothetical protein